MPSEWLLEWSEYGNGTHDLTRAVNKEVIDCSVGVNGRIQASWNTTKPGDVRQIITPEGVIELLFNEDNTVTIFLYRLNSESAKILLFPENLYAIDSSFDFTEEKVQIINQFFLPKPSDSKYLICLQNGTWYVGTVYLATDNHWSMVIHSYAKERFYHIFNNNGTLSLEQINCTSIPLS